MTSSFDRSQKDKQYFINSDTYNCPFCKRRNVKFQITGQGSYDSSNNKAVWFYLIECTDCNKTSFHLSNHELQTWSLGNGCDQFSEPLQRLEWKRIAPNAPLSKQPMNALDDNNFKIIDDLFFYHMPTSFFTIDERIPKKIREPLTEADTSLKSNLLTGASGGLRKAIFKLLKIENIPEKDSEDAFVSHDERVDQLKDKHPKIDPELFDELKAVHTLTSQELHENDWEDFDAPTLRFLISVTNEILTEIYVIPDEIKKRREEIAALKNKAKPKKTLKDD